MTPRSTVEYQFLSFLRQALILPVILVASGCSTFSLNSRDPWLASDKAMHLFAGVAVGATGTGIAHTREFSTCGATASGVGLAFTIGLAKEWRDSYTSTGTVSGRDLIATVVGGLIGAQLVSECQ